MISRFSTGTFRGFHYSVESTGRSARNAEAVHTAGAFIPNGVADAPTYTQLTGAAPYVARPPAASGSPPAVTP